jgi:hypothetical protein
MYYHQIYFQFTNTKKTIPNESVVIKSYLQQNCSSLIYNLWNFEDAKTFVKTNYPIFFDFFTMETTFPILKCDFFRYLLMYHYGGIYTDLDFIAIRPFETFIHLLNNGKINYFPNTVKSPSIILSEEWLNSSTYTNTLHNGILISLKEKHPFWMKLVMEIYNNVIFLNNVPTKNDDVFFISGPKKLCSYFKENIQFFNDVCVLPYYYFCPYISIENGERKMMNNAMIENMTENVQWVFHNITEHNNLFKRCPNSFFVCVFLNSGSMWK